ncbi:MAG: GTP cyclohydrolase I FolE [Flavobacteriales bacterium]
MKQKETLWSTLALEEIEALGDQHLSSNTDTPLREDAFTLSDEEKMQLITKHFAQIMQIMGLDLTDDSLKGTPARVAKMYVQEIFSGLNPANKPSIKLFENKYKYNEMLIEKNIKVHSFCEHHFVPIIGKAHVAYISNGKVIGLSKLNRVVDYYCRRPQVQERLTEQIAQELKEVLKTEDIAVMINAEHMCVSMRGIEQTGCSTITSHYSGRFREARMRDEFIKLVTSGK